MQTGVKIFVNQDGSKVRVMIHTPNHNRDDECWDIQYKGGDKFAIVKSKNR